MNAAAVVTPEPALESYASPYVLLRMAGMPFDELLDLRFERTVALLEERYALERGFAAGREELSATLYAAAPKVEDPKTRRLVLDFRRAVFNDRAPKKALQSLRILRPHWDRATRAAVLDWYRRVARYARLEAKLASTYAGELREKRDVLRALFGREDFLKGVQLSTTDFYDALRKSLAAPVSSNASIENLEASAMLYLGRMATKPSPFATFTPTAVGTFGPKSELHVDRAARSRVRCNGTLVQLLARELSQVPAIRETLTVRVRDGFWPAANEILFIRPEYSFSPFYHRKDVVGRVARTPQLVQLARTLASEPKTYGELEADVVAPLVADGFLVCAIELDPTTDDMLAALIAALAPVADPNVLRCHAALTRMHDAVAAFGDATHDVRRTLLATMRAAVAEILELFGFDRRIASLDLVKEDCGVTGLAFTAGNALQDAFVSDFAPLLESFQLGHVQHTPEMLRQLRDVSGGKPVGAMAFLEHYSRAQSIVLSRRGNEGFASVAPVMLETEQQLSRLTAAALGAARRNGSDVVGLELEAHDVPSLRGWQSSVSAFVQVAADSPEAIDRGDYLVVVNRTYSGLGTYAARFCGLYDDGVNGDPLTAMMREHFDRVGEGAECVELSLIGDMSDVQLHPAITRRSLAWPGDASRGRGLSFNDLAISYDATADALRVVERATGRTLMPLYLGSIQPLAMPQPMPTVINAITPATYPFTRDFWRHLAPEALADESGTVQDVVRLPRVQFGRVVVARGGWRVAASAVPLPRKGESDALYFARVHRWREELGMPELMFVRPDLDAVSAAQTRRHKPMLLDFRNPWVTHTLGRVAAQGVQQLFFVEMLPSPAQLPVTVAGRRIVSELQLEWNWKESRA